jgi:large subunit ribosomal protein L32
MIVPARRTSRARRDQRRAHRALREPARANCPQCGEPRAPHRVCQNCGFYRDRTVIETDED